MSMCGFGFKGGGGSEREINSKNFNIKKKEKKGEKKNQIEKKNGVGEMNINFFFLFFL